MRAFVKLIAVFVVLISLAILGYGAYWVNPTAFLIRLKLIMGSVGSGRPPSERGRVCDFETPKDIMSWKSSGCTLTLSTDYHKSGRSGGKLSFDGGKGYAGTKLEDYVFGPGSCRDWSSFERLSLWLQNGGAEGIDIDIQVKDFGERRFHHEVRLGPGAEELVSIGLEAMSDTVDLTRITSIVLGTDGPVGELDVFVDEIRLIGEGEPLGQPYIVLSGMDVPPVASRGETVVLKGYLRAEKPVTNDYRIFLHIYPEDQAALARASEMAGMINADHDPSVETSLWKVGVDQPVGPLKIHIPEDNPTGRYLIEMGLFNPRAYGRAHRGGEYRGAHDFSGTYPRCRYANPGMSGYIVGGFEVR